MILRFYIPLISFLRRQHIPSIINMSAKRKIAASFENGTPGKQQKLSSFFKVAEVATSNKKPIQTTAALTVEQKGGGIIGVAEENVQIVGGLPALLTEKSWKSLLRTEFSKPYFKEIEQFLKTAEENRKVIFPPKPLIFNAFNLTPLHELKVVIIGQDPYHGIGQAHGLCFSVPKGIEPPPSLKNIFTELAADIPGFQKPSHGCLEAWAKQGVLLLNATLTVEAHKANSHANIGWQTFTDAVIKTISQQCTGLVFILWGGFAHRKSALIDVGPRRGHVIIKTAHPSPLSSTKFFGCRCFSKANEALKKNGKSEIDWNLK